MKIILQESGYTFPSCGQKFFGTITIISADNVAANLLGGFKEGATANRGADSVQQHPETSKQRWGDQCRQRHINLPI